jgi:hypothetical protein
MGKAHTQTGTTSAAADHQDEIHEILIAESEYTYLIDFP